MPLAHPYTEQANKLFPDDPLEKEPAPIAVRSPNPKVASYLYEAFANTLRERGERHPPGGVIPALGINTLGEVMDGAWFTNRHGKRRMGLEELRRGPAVDKPPAPGVWRVLLVKPYGELTGLIIKDSNQRGYLVRFDPPGHLEMATGATMVTSRVFHALGYWVPENYIVNFDRSRLVASPEGADITSLGEARRLMEEDIDRFLKTVPQTRTGGYRASATLVPDGEPLGPFQFHGTRTDDPNDLFPHDAPMMTARSREAALPSALPALAANGQDITPATSALARTVPRLLANSPRLVANLSPPSPQLPRLCSIDASSASERSLGRRRALAPVECLVSRPLGLPGNAAGRAPCSEGQAGVLGTSLHAGLRTVRRPAPDSPRSPCLRHRTGTFRPLASPAPVRTALRRSWPLRRRRRSNCRAVDPASARSRGPAVRASRPPPRRGGTSREFPDGRHRH